MNGADTRTAATEVMIVRTSHNVMLNSFRRAVRQFVSVRWPSNAGHLRSAAARSPAHVFPKPYGGNEQEQRRAEPKRQGIELHWRIQQNEVAVTGDDKIQCLLISIA